ncbi:tlde1 domain-containing protein [Tatumella sp. JGM118]|uniref:tlde1 domain-containing protein n=1 Tax=Tatumella sp. JGM118 TaxID=2799796 RepID=UPI001BAE98BD|nr:DUF2778 domain-containing protein [Tatumella sp. JGM118]
MTWTYIVSERKFYLNDVYQFDAMYAGAPGFKNMPVFQCIKNKGPLPAGTYTINPPRYSPLTGPYSLPLIPHRDNAMCGRTGFVIHGDSQKFPGTASKGCIVADFGYRRTIWNSGDHRLVIK